MSDMHMDSTTKEERVRLYAPELYEALAGFVKRGDELYKSSGWPALLQPALGEARALLARIDGGGV